MFEATFSASIESENPIAIYKIHITIGPINPSDSIINSFKKVCKDNDLKPIDVGVLYRTGFVRFLQSSKYIVSNLREAHEKRKGCTKLFKDAGLEVIREKIEAMASYIPKLPRGLYYENHIVINVRSDYLTSRNEFVRTDNIITADKLNRDFNKELRVNVPLSFNMKHTDMNQCFITTRVYHDTRANNDVHVDKCLTTIKDNGFEVIKVIREAVIYDTNNAVDAEPKFDK